MKEQDIKTSADLLAYILEYQDVIYVREKVDGKMKTVALKNLDSKAKANKIARFLEEGIIPVRLLRDGEERENAQ